jgi:hypothetical protein
MGRRSARETELLRAAAGRLHGLPLYPAAVRTRHVRVVSAPWLFGLPWFRRFAGYACPPLILVRRPLDQVSEDLITHELVHVWQDQHRRLRLWLSYLWQGYRLNEHEVEAREAVRRTRA